jgi:hypothetical protein
MRNRFREHFALTTVALLLSTINATAAWVKERDLSFVMTGREFHGEYSNGVKFVEIYRKSGKIEYRDYANTLTGSWKIRSGTFCIEYDQTTGGCFQILKPSGNCIEYWVVNKEGKPAASWIARGWHNKYPSTC